MICSIKVKPINKDIGYQLIPVYLDAGVSFSTYSFSHNGNTVPHIVRSEVDKQIRCYIWFRPTDEEEEITVTTG